MHTFDKIGVAGCGRMGLPMLGSLRAAGMHADGFDVRDVGVLTDVDAFALDLRTLITVVRDADETEKSQIVLIFRGDLRLFRRHWTHGSC